MSSRVDSRYVETYLEGFGSMRDGFIMGLSV